MHSEVSASMIFFLVDWTVDYLIFPRGNNPTFVLYIKLENELQNQQVHDKQSICNP